jgi:hypothetical protein
MSFWGWVDNNGGKVMLILALVTIIDTIVVLWKILSVPKGGMIQ